MRFRSNSSMQRTKAASAAVSRHWWKAWRQPPHPCGSLCSAALRYRLQQPPPRRLNTCNHNYSIEIAAANRAPITSTHTRVWRQIHARHHASNTPLLAQYLYGSVSHAVAGMSCKASVTSHTLGAAHAAANLFHVVHFCDAGSSGVAGGRERRGTCLRLRRCELLQHHVTRGTGGRECISQERRRCGSRQCHRARPDPPPPPVTT